MSAYIVENDTINNIVHTLHYICLLEPEKYPRISRKDFLWTDDTNVSMLGRAMLQINVRAVDQRYSEANDIPEFRYFKTKPLSLVQLAKSLSCFLYQCTEGDVPETSGLYNALQEYRSELALRYLMNSEEYNNAEWA